MTRTRQLDDYADLAMFTMRGSLEHEHRQAGARVYDDLRGLFTVTTGTWEHMLGQVLTQLAEDAGNLAHALHLLDLPCSLTRAWVRGAEQGTNASVGWLSRQPRESQGPRIRQRRHRRGEDYADLAASARSFRLRGSGDLDPARFRARYSIIRRRSWHRMVADLLGQVVADLGSCERASTMLGVKLGRLIRWVQWLVSRGLRAPAQATWPLAWVPHIDRVLPYADLATAVMRGALDDDGKGEPELVPLVQLQSVYRVEFGSWRDMEHSLLQQIAADAGSIRRASEAIALPRSTYSARLRRFRDSR